MQARRTPLSPAAIATGLLLALGAASPAAATVSAKGDFNGDGRSDLAIGSPDDSVEGNDRAGAVNVLYGSASGLTGSGGDLWTQGTPGVKGAVGRDGFGASLAGGRR